MKVAIVHDWMTNQGGGERVVWALHKAYPDAPIFTSVYRPESLPQFADVEVKTSFLQNWPLAKSKHQLYPLLRTIAFESFDLSEYDVVISSSSAESKGVITQPQTLHLCYIHTPTRYYWSDYAKYRRSTGFGWLSPLVRLVMPPLINRLRLWDFAAAQRVDSFVANSHYVAERVNKYYRRPATVIHPPIDVARFQVNTNPRQGFVVVSRLIPYKRVDLAVAACTRLNLPLTVIGDGSELEALKKLAGPTVRFVGRLSDDEVAIELGRAKAFLFTADEDFGLTPLEAMACGTPVIAFKKGGALETVVDGVTGRFFDEQTPESLVAALEAFDEDDYSLTKIRAHAERFDESVFITQIQKAVERDLKQIRKSTS